jgi:primosomal protein N'
MGIVNLFLVVLVLKEYLKEVKKNFPSKKIEIFSSDTMNKKSSSEKLEKIINNEVQILVGTQLISKGFHFPSLNCIVVVDIDLSYKGHDLRGAEKNYSYIINFLVELEELENLQLCIFKLIIQILK